MINEPANFAQAKRYGAAAMVYAAALLYTTGDAEKAQTARQLALCYLGLGQTSKYGLWC